MGLFKFNYNPSDETIRAHRIKVDDGITQVQLKNLEEDAILRALHIIQREYADQPVAIDFSYSAVDDKIGPELLKIPHLVSLNFNETKVTDAIGESLVQLPELTSLRLYLNSNTHPHSITDKFGSYLSQMTQLKELVLSSAGLTDGIGPHLAGLKHLEFLSLAYPGIGDNECAIGPHIASLQQLKQLSALDYVFCKIDDRICPWIGELKNLEKLFIQGMITDHHIGPQLEKLTHLKELRLSSKGTTENLEPYLKALPQLKVAYYGFNAVQMFGDPKLQQKAPDLIIPRGATIIPGQDSEPHLGQE